MSIGDTTPQNIISLIYYSYSNNFIHVWKVYII